MRRRRWSVPACSALLLGVVLPFGAVTAAASPAVASPSQASPATVCAVTWGSQPRTAAAHTAAPITDVRAGRQACYDRLVVDVAGAGAGYDVRYVDQVIADGSGQVVPLRGGAKLQVVVRAPAYDANGNATYRPADRRELVNVTGFQTFRQLALAGSFEGVTTIGAGVRARLPFRVLVLDGPGSSSRIVVDVAHRW